ncbi:methyltransferase domain-containing protein [Rheinheimera soli]|uniref:SAM-dependent methyltransferase n=1 Tax=Rheinheimera soli TaxID=443616 RepID=A0ABU1W535_9GAMM|nr:methyltransferase domain-containing protein [Rheinheimera soli]MDR7123082.1 SAM-dependent methyltransferase [Rheinheimera soli]
MEKILTQDHHLFNLHSAGSLAEVDRINKKFYGRFNFPWNPSMLAKYHDQKFWIKTLNQELGYFDHKRLFEKPKIWVAGCGTNQAVITALKYPDSEVLGTDLSKESLAAARSLAERMNVENLKLEERSINEVEYDNEFDMVICTGVIHHNFDPSSPLASLERALKRNGILELFVYNYYHRITTTSFQKAIRMMCSTSRQPNIDVELPISSYMIRDTAANYSSLMKSFLEPLVDEHESAMADAILQPVEFSYTVETFNSLVQAMDLEIVTPCLNQWDKAEDRLSWEMNFSDKAVAEQYMSLPDIIRWQVGNLLKLEQSPHVWFYVQRKDSDFAVKTSQQICAEFLNTRFKKLRTTYELHVMQEDSSYKLEDSNKKQPDPVFPKDKVAARVFEHCTGQKSIGEILKSLRMELGYHELNELRLRLTTPAYPYLEAVA